MLITVGLFTRIAAFIASGEMAVAYFWISLAAAEGPVRPASGRIDQRLGGNGGEPAILFCFAFLLLATTGAGALSADSRRRGRVAATGAAPRRRFGRFRR